MRHWRTDHPRAAEHREKARVVAKANYALRTGKIEREPCHVCGRNAQMHHPDYTKPLEVVWVCRKHHMAAHHESGGFKQTNSLPVRYFHKGFNKC